MYGSYVSGNLTINSDLDICIIWDAPDALSPLLAEHKGVRIDMEFLTPQEVEDVIEGRNLDDMKIAEVIGRLRNAEAVFDPEGVLKEWMKRAREYLWPTEVIVRTKNGAEQILDRAEEYAKDEDMESAVHEVRRALFELGKGILMRNNVFGTIRPAETLTEVRLLDPIVYQLFLRTFKLKGFDEEGLLEILADIDRWVNAAEERFAADVGGDAAVLLFNQVKREYHGAMNLTYAGDYELAVLEMRHTTNVLGKLLLTLGGRPLSDSGALVRELREREPEYYEKIFRKYGGFEFQLKGVERSIGEARFIAQRL